MNDLWSFNFHKGPAMLNAVVRATSETQALDVATAWCRANNYRPPAGIRPFVVAGPEILKTEQTEVVSAPAPIAPKFTDQLKAAFGV